MKQATKKKAKKKIKKKVIKHKEIKMTDATKDKDLVTGTTKVPSSGPMTPSAETDVKANTLNQAEAPKQAKKLEKTEAVVPEPDPNYKFEVEQLPHKVTAKAERGLTYNYHVVCEYCAWEGRYLYQDEAEDAAKDHLLRKFPRRG